MFSLRLVIFLAFKDNQVVKDLGPCLIRLDNVINVASLSSFQWVGKFQLVVRDLLIVHPIFEYDFSSWFSSHYSDLCSGPGVVEVTF